MRINRSNEISKYFYPILLIIAEICGVLSVILVALFYPANGRYEYYDWKTNPFSYHPLMMTIGLVFCYGNGIILYRTFPKVSKYPVKLCHAFLLISSFVFAAVGLSAIIRSKELSKGSHFLTYHSWIGLTTLILFVLQWICGFVSFLFPQLSLEIRQLYMPRLTSLSFEKKTNINEIF